MKNGSCLVRQEPKQSYVGPLVLGVGGRSPRAGILTSGSALLRLPLPKAERPQWVFAVARATTGDELPGYSGGTAPDSHRLP